MDNFYDYIRERSSWSGCKQNKWDCGKYLDCDICLQDKIAEHEKQIKADAIDEYSSKLWQVIEKATVNCKLDFTIDDLHNLEIIIKGLAEELKEQNNE